MNPPLALLCQMCYHIVDRYYIQLCQVYFIFADLGRYTALVDTTVSTVSVRKAFALLLVIDIRLCQWYYRLAD